MGGPSEAKGVNEIVFSKISGLPVGVGGKRGMVSIALRANCAATTEVVQIVSSLVKEPSGAISTLNCTTP